MGLIRKAATAVEDAPAVEAAQCAEEAKNPIDDAKDAIKYAMPGHMPFTLSRLDHVEIAKAVLMSPLIANLALTVPEDKRGELIEKYYDLAMKLISK